MDSACPCTLGASILQDLGSAALHGGRAGPAKLNIAAKHFDGRLGRTQVYRRDRAETYMFQPQIALGIRTREAESAIVIMGLNRTHFVFHQVRSSSLLGTEPRHHPHPRIGLHHV